MTVYISAVFLVLVYRSKNLKKTHDHWIKYAIINKNFKADEIQVKKVIVL